MSLNKETRSSSGISLEDLVKMNGEAMAVLDEVPYHPVVYAVPKEWLESWMKLLGNAVQFQPTLYEKITPLATQAELEKQQVNLKADVEVAKREILKELEKWKEQDGSQKEKYSSELSKEHSATVKAIRDEYAGQQKKNLRYMGIIVGASAILSALVSGLCLLLGG